MWRHFLLLVQGVFLSIRVISLFVTLDLPQSQKLFPHFEIDFYSFQFKEIRSNRFVNLIEGYFRAANRSSKKLTDF